jgi:hypothetical protein
VPKQRGRPPKYCDEHNPKNSEKKTEDKVSETRKAPPGGAKSKARPAPPTKSETRKPPRVSPPPKSELDEPTPGEDKATMTESGAMKRLPPPGKADTQSRAKAENAARHADAQQPDTSWPVGVNGRPMARIEFSASELIPTGQYANVSVGPARITAFVDLNRTTDNGEAYFSDAERDNLVKSVNELAEMVERDVVAVQRNLVLESIQDQKATE